MGCRAAKQPLAIHNALMIWALSSALGAFLTYALGWSPCPIARGVGHQAYNPGLMQPRERSVTVAVMEDGTPLPLTHRLRMPHWVALDVCLAVILGATSAIIDTQHVDGTTHAGQASTILRYVAVGVACAPLPARRRYPKQVLGLVVVGEAVLIGLGFRVPALLAGGFAMYSLAAISSSALPYRIVVAAAIGTFLVAGIPAWDSRTVETIIFASGATLVGWLAGENAGARRSHALAMAERAAEMAERAAEYEREQARSRAIEERARIARELHDVVAHAMSVISVRSGAARVIREKEPEKTAEALSIIEIISRRSLVELRRIVAVLRDAGDPQAAELDPAPGLEDLPALVNQIAAAGVDVDVHVEGEVRPLPPTEDLSAYRIAQEALTNVVRHSGADRAILWVRYRPESVEIECVDGGGSGVHRRAVDHVNGGHGLIGMRERVAIFGGEFSADACDPGFRVVARLPATEESQ